MDRDNVVSNDYLFVNLSDRIESDIFTIKNQIEKLREYKSMLLEQLNDSKSLLNSIDNTHCIIKQK